MQCTDLPLQAHLQRVVFRTPVVVSVKQTLKLREATQVELRKSGAGTRVSLCQPGSPMSRCSCISVRPSALASIFPDAVLISILRRFVWCWREIYPCGGIGQQRIGMREEIAADIDECLKQSQRVS